MVTPRGEPQLTAKERAIVREMMLEYQNARLRKAWMRAMIGSSRSLMAFLVVATLIMLQVLQIVLSLHQLKGK